MVPHQWQGPSSSYFSDSSCVVFTTGSTALALESSGLAALTVSGGHAAVGPAPALGSRWHWSWTDPFWKRVAVHAALGSRDHARAALAQARGRWKKSPKEFATLINSLDAGSSR